ncbi:MAG: phosphoribosylformylglycinamidine synthase subunit PurS, partial [Hyphomicrobiales bacterium]|nr:phosphoribosylformylglycinamidine synthase subunit PurS [Hyphomicrobiales bacterium]MCY4048843.1 phosphoribosylformylglycinamidine synthase subunit PurS [Hyphomicrobiales bacterium]
RNSFVNMQATIAIMPKAEILDPQSRATADTLKRLGFPAANLRQGKRITLTLDETDPEQARNTIEKMCKTLLVNELIEEYHIEIHG